MSKTLSESCEHVLPREDEGAMVPYGVGLKMAAVFGRCVLCQRRSAGFGYLCEHCDGLFDWQVPSFELIGEQTLGVQPATHYDGIMKQAICAFKDKEVLTALPLLLQALFYLNERLCDLPEDTLIVPVPTTQGRLRERGFYPVQLLADYLSALTGFGIYRGVCRPFERQRQRGLDRQARLNNLSGVFAVERLPSSRTLLLFDDVATTGATLLELADTLWQTDKTLTITAVCVAHGKQD